MSLSEQITSAERRIQELESRHPSQAHGNGTSLADADAVSIQAFLQGALAAGAAGRPDAAAIDRSGAGAAWASLFACNPPQTPTDTGQTEVRAYWWGFHVQLSHADLLTVLDSADVVNDLVGLIGGNIPSPAQPWIKLLAPFISATHQALRGLDHGRGIYISMSWVTPGIFIPTSV
jgi:hypothetical protein